MLLLSIWAHEYMCKTLAMYLKTFLWNPSGFSNFRGCLFNQFCAEKLVEEQIIECMASLECAVYNSDRIAGSELA